MEMKIIEGSQFQTIILNGKLDMDGVKSIEEGFKKITTDKNTIIDMTNVEYLASLGIRVILQSAKAAAKNGKKILIMNPRKNVLGVLQLANLDTLVPVISSMEEVGRYL